jgi:nucleoside phosphorylase
MEEQEKRWTIFLSYSSQDRLFADRLYQKLCDAGITVWYDEKEILIGDDILSKIGEGLSGSDFLLVVLSETAINSNWVKAELAPKILQRVDRQKVTILPIVLGDVDPEKLANYLGRTLLAGTKWFRFPPGESDKAFDQLLYGITRHSQFRNLPLQDEFHYDAYISYSYEDREWVDNVLLPILELEGLRLCIDYCDFKIGVPTLVNIEGAVETSHKSLFILTSNWVRSEWPTFESLLDQTSDPVKLGYRIVPILVEYCTFPQRLRDFTFLDLTKPTIFDHQIQRLVKAIRTSKIKQKPVNPASAHTAYKEDIKLKDMPNEGVNKSPRVPSSVDVGVIIALKEEFTEFYNEIKGRCKPLHDEETGRYYYQFEHTSADSNHGYRCIATFVGEMGAVKASLTTQRLISQWEPRTLVMLGIAAALSKDVHIGDVVVASQVDGYLENAKAVPATGGAEYVFTLSGEVYRSSSDLLHAVRNFEFVHAEIFRDWQDRCADEFQQMVSRESLDQSIAGKRLQDQVQMVDGHLASGPTVGAAPAFKDWLKKRDRKYLALEMEAGGLMTAVYEQADPKRSLVLRGISDDGDEHKEDWDKMGEGAFRRYAMHNAIQLLWRFFDAGILPSNKPLGSPTTLGGETTFSTSGNPATRPEVREGSIATTQTSSSMPMSKPSRTSAFISYSHKDRKYLDELHVHLAQYVRMGIVDFWDDTKILPGSKWHEEIKKALEFAKVAVLLVSADFLASDYIATDELPPLLTAAEQEGATILPVILRPCAFKDTNLAQFQAINTPSKPLSNMTRGKREEVWTKVAAVIKNTLQSPN